MTYRTPLEQRLRDVAAANDLEPAKPLEDMTMRELSDRRRILVNAKERCVYDNDHQLPDYLESLITEVDSEMRQRRRIAAARLTGEAKLIRGHRRGDD
jgi:hypothetical protein